MPSKRLAARQPMATLPEPAERMRLRRLFGISQSELADSLGVNRKSVYHWESGKSEPRGEPREAYAGLLKSWAQTEKLRRDASECTS
jgi:DNA-binding XRE family transcriptional regulator